MPAERERGPARVALGRVVEYHVEDHLDAGAVQRLHQVAEFVHRAQRVGLRAVGPVRREPGDRLVAPIVRAVRRGLGVELLHRHQLDGPDAKVDAGTEFSRSGRRRCRVSPARRRNWDSA